MLYDMAALAAALSIAISNVIAPSAIRQLGPVVFNAVRLSAALLAVVALVSLKGSWAVPSLHDVIMLAASSILGIMVADSCFYAALARLGPRRTAVLYASWSAFAAVLGYLLLGETLSLMKVIGLGCIIAGVWLAIIFCQPAGISEETYGSLRAGMIS